MDSWDDDKSIYKYDKVELIRLYEWGTLFLMTKGDVTKYFVLDDEDNPMEAIDWDLTADDVKLLRLLFEK